MTLQAFQRRWASCSVQPRMMGIPGCHSPCGPSESRRLDNALSQSVSLRLPPGTRSSLTRRLPSRAHSSARLTRRPPPRPHVKQDAPPWLYIHWRRVALAGPDSHRLGVPMPQGPCPTSHVVYHTHNDSSIPEGAGVSFHAVADRAVVFAACAELVDLLFSVAFVARVACPMDCSLGFDHRVCKAVRVM